MASQFAPVYVDEDGNRMLFPWGKDWLADDERAAWEIGWGGAFVEGILLGVKYKGETIELVDSQIPHVKAQLGLASVVLIGGPMFDEAVKEYVHATQEERNGPDPN